MSESAMSYWDVIEAAFDSVTTWMGAEKYDEDAARYPSHVQHLLAIHWADAEICNGGFGQFFDNSAGVLAPQARDGFAAIGRNDLAALLEQAMARLGEPYLRDRDARCDRLEEIDPDFDDLEEQYYSLVSGLRADLDRYAGIHTTDNS